LQQWLLFYNWKETLCLPGLLPVCWHCLCVLSNSIRVFLSFFRARFLFW
jgi:hypothetical protein